MARENYVGRAGQLAVMAEFLLRGYNVAIPEVDEGDDIFVAALAAYALVTGTDGDCQTTSLVLGL
jgi:hypothetical protein